LATQGAIVYFFIFRNICGPWAQRTGLDTHAFGSRAQVDLGMDKEISFPERTPHREKLCICHRSTELCSKWKYEM